MMDRRFEARPALTGRSRPAPGVVAPGPKPTPEHALMAGPVPAQLGIYRRRSEAAATLTYSLADKHRRVR